jgi:acyl carrier protein
MGNLTTEQVQEKIIAILRGYLDQEKKDVDIPADIGLTELGLDSFKAIYLLLDLEEAFQIQIPDSVLAPEIFVSPASLKNVVESLL